MDFNGTESEKNMKILFCLGSMDKGGAQRVIANLSNYLSTENDVGIITTSNRNSQYYLNNNIVRYYLDNQNKKTNNIKRIIKLNRIIKNVRPDVIVTFQPEPSFRILLLRLFNKIPTILSVRNDPNVEYSNLKRKILMKILYPVADGYVFQTEDAKKYFSKKIQNKSTVIPNPISETFLLEQPYTGKRENTIVTVGRIEKQKNQRLLIDAFKEIEKEYKEYKLIIYGEGRLEKDLKEYCKELKLINKIIFKGQVDNVKEEILKAGMFVLPSDYEGMPNALMEAMALGLPCISTDCPCGGPKALIKNDYNGILIRVNDLEQIKNAIRKIIEQPEFSEKIGNNARQISKTLNPKDINNKWKKYINSVKNN